ncbi:solute carrier family 49 member 4 homolog [Oratosquilla oratoria]|uniref:solute carrier family 49 member 4 homolog n=1 Tax=Oratosquilla oratoria TaxID=337810 RepID=UPI003F75C523
MASGSRPIMKVTEEMEESSQGLSRSADSSRYYTPDEDSPSEDLPKETKSHRSQRAPNLLMMDEDTLEELLKENQSEKEVHVYPDGSVDEVDLLGTMSCSPGTRIPKNDVDVVFPVQGVEDSLQEGEDAPDGGRIDGGRIVSGVVILSASEPTHICSLEPTEATRLLAKARPENQRWSSVGTRLSPGEETAVTSERFWILGVFAILSCMTSFEWNTWGPISETAIAIFPDWSPSTIALFANWNYICGPLFIVPACWIPLRAGLKVIVVLCGSCLALAMTVRCAAFQTSLFTLMCHASSFLTGTACLLAITVPPMIAAVWFPPQERTSALAIFHGFNEIGCAFSYLEPLFVKSPGHHHNVTDSDIEVMENDVHRLLYIGMGISLALLLAVVARFPSRPRAPPSVSATVDRDSFLQSGKNIVRKVDMWLLFLSYGVSAGTLGAWIAVFDLTLAPLGIHQDEAMWVGVAAIVGASFGSMISGAITDRLYGYIKPTILILLLASSAILYYFFLISRGNLPPVKWQIYACVVLAETLGYATNPLFFELAVECAYPCAEVVVSAFLVTSANVVSALFLAGFSLPGVGVEWASSALLGTVSLSTLPLLLMREEYARTRLDRPLRSSVHWAD